MFEVCSEASGLCPSDDFGSFEISFGFNNSGDEPGLLPFPYMLSAMRQNINGTKRNKGRFS